MPATDSPALVVARFLKSNDYNESYDAFIAEAGLEPDAGVVAKGDLTIEALLEEKRTWDLSIDFEKLGLQSDGVGEKEEGWWTSPAPAVAKKVTTLPSASNILSVSAEKVRVGNGETLSSLIFVSTADRRLHILQPGNRTLRSSLTGIQDAPILACAVYQGKYLLTSSMSGQVVLSDVEGRALDKRRDHTKYVVKAAIYEHSTEPLIATAGWDGKIMLYRPTSDVTHEIQLGDPIAVITLPTKPESMVFTRHPDAGEPVLIISRTDSSNLYYYTTEATPRLIGRQNLAPYSNAWVAFTPSALALCPTDPSLLAIGTSTVPHMKLLIVRLLVPPYEEEDKSNLPINPTVTLRRSLLDDNRGDTETQASQARTALALAEREHAAIQIHCTTLAPQTAYSTPAVAWRPDGTGVWVNGDDGGVRGIEARSGKVIATLHGHDAGSKVRCLWAGMIEDEFGKEGTSEILVSGGFDQNLIVWSSGVGAGASS